MLRIPCPFGGLRDQTEFRYGGPARRLRPADPAAASDANWAAYLFYRDNPRGPYHERWVHVFGCRQWLSLVRDTCTHEFLPAAPKPEDAAP